MKNELLKRILSSIILIPITFFLIFKGSFLFNIFIFFCFLISSYEWHMMCKKKPYYFPGFLFLFFSFLSAFKLINYIDTYQFFLSIIIVCISTDIGGYVFGKILKGPKLTKISPKKTYTGMLGSYFFAILFLNIIYPSFSDFVNPFETNFKFIIFIILVSTFSQLGDIIISYFKRLSKIKDTGKIIPGHGGLLDRIDGMIFAFPFSYIILKFNIFQYF